MTDFFVGIGDSVATAFTSLGSAITGAAASAANWLYDLTQDSQFSLTSIYSVSQLATDVIDEWVDEFVNFNDSTWNKLSDGAKYVIYSLRYDLLDPTGTISLALYIVERISIASNFLNDLIEIDEYAPFPFNVLETDDFFDVVDCMDDLVLESAITFAENVATTLVDLGDNFDITPLFNTEDIKDELNVTYQCLVQFAKEVKQRDVDASDDSNIISSLLDDALEYFEFEEFVMGLEIGFTACTLGKYNKKIYFFISLHQSGYIIVFVLI